MKRLKKEFHRLHADSRLYHFDRPILGLTGGIGTGKSTVTKLLEAKGLTVIDADQLVKLIYKKEESKEFVKTNFPEVWAADEINFPKLRELFFLRPGVKEKVEAFIHARLPEAFQEATRHVRGQDFFIYDVPLLFERDLRDKVDLAIVVYAPEGIQIARIMDRDGNHEDFARRILGHQSDIEVKREQADFVIRNTGTLTELAAEVDQLLLQILE